MQRINFLTNPIETGLTTYALIKNASVRYWNGSAFATFTTTRGTWDVPMTETPSGTGQYDVAFPTAIPPGFYYWEFYKQVGGSPSHASDVRYGSGDGYWTGQNFVADAPEIYAPLSAIGSQSIIEISDTGPQKTGALLGYTVRLSHQTHGDGGGFISSLRRVTAHTYDDPVHTITLSSAPDFTIDGTETAEFYRPSGLSNDLADEIDMISGTATDPDFDPVDSNLTWVLTPHRTYGLYARETDVANLTVGTSPKYAIDFRHVLRGGYIREVNTIAIQTGTVGGVTFASTGRDHSLAKVNITGVTAGDYTIRCKITTNTLATIEGDVVLKVVANS